MQQSLIKLNVIGAKRNTAIGCIPIYRHESNSRASALLELSYYNRGGYIENIKEEIE